MDFMIYLFHCNVLIYTYYADVMLSISSTITTTTNIYVTFLNFLSRVSLGELLIETCNSVIIKRIVLLLLQKLSWRSWTK